MDKSELAINRSYSQSSIRIYAISKLRDLELLFASGAVEQLITCASEDESASQIRLFFKDPTEDKWINFVLRLNIVKLLMKGYRKFVQKARLIG